MTTDYESLARRLAAALDRLLPYALSRAEDLDETKRAGKEDPNYPGADVAAEACESADRLLVECRGLGVAAAPVTDVGAALASALRSYATAPHIVQKYGQDLADRAAQILGVYDQVADRKGTEHAGVRLAMSMALREYVRAPGVLEHYGRLNLEAGQSALEAYDRAEMEGRQTLPLRVDPIGVAKQVMRHMLDESPGSYTEQFRAEPNEGAAGLVEDTLNAMGLDSVPRMDDRVGELFDEAHEMLEAATEDNTPAP